VTPWSILQNAERRLPRYYLVVRVAVESEQREHTHQTTTHSETERIDFASLGCASSLVLGSIDHLPHLTLNPTLTYLKKSKGKVWGHFLRLGLTNLKVLCIRFNQERKMPTFAKPKFCREEWRRQHLAKTSKCKFCDSVVCTHTMARHQKTTKCFRLRFQKFSFRD